MLLINGSLLCHNGSHPGELSYHHSQDTPDEFTDKDCPVYTYGLGSDVRDTVVVTMKNTFTD